MCDNYNACQTFSGTSCFFWCLEDDVYYVRNGRDGSWNVSLNFLATQYADSQALILSQPNGTPLGASGIAIGPAQSLGVALLAVGKTQPLASYVRLDHNTDEEHTPTLNPQADWNSIIDTAANELCSLATRVESTEPLNRKNYELNMADLGSEVDYEASVYSNQ